MLKSLNDDTTLGEAIELINNLDDKSGIDLEDYKKIQAIKDLLKKKVSFGVDKYFCVVP